MRYYTTDGTYMIQLQARGLGKTYAEETFRKLKEAYKGGYTHAKRWRVRNMMYSEFITKVLEAQKMYGNKFEDPLVPFYESVIELVYMYHPLQFNKDEIATLYCIGGPGLMRELRDTALNFRDLEDDVKAVQTRLNEAKQDQEHALRCYLDKK